MFGADIARTIGEIQRRRGLMWTVLRVHVLEGDGPDKFVGLEIVAKTPLSYWMTPFSLSAVDARRLAAMLQAATYDE